MRNPDISIHNRHTAIIADSGAGKSVALSGVLASEKGKFERVLIWDTNEDHNKICKNRYIKVRNFAGALADDVVAREVGGERDFYISSYVGVEDCKEFEAWCMAVCKSLNGSIPTLVIIEELAGVSETVSRAGEWFKRLINQGRKYGAVVIFTTQRPQEVPKTAYSQCAIHMIGSIRDTRTREYLMKSLGLSYLSSQLAEIKKGEFLRAEGDIVKKINVFKQGKI